MICLRCDNEEFVVKPDAVIPQEFKGELLDIHTPAMACTKCGWLTVDLDQADELRRHTANAYRVKHGLLTSDAIRAIRELLGKNQREFAAFLGVGEASVKRWETWLVQEKGYDELIRLKSREALMQKPTTGAWFCVVYHETIEYAPNGVTVQTEVAQKIPQPSRWALALNIDVDPNEQGETQLSLCLSNHHTVYGPSPPRRDDAAFSLSASY